MPRTANPFYLGTGSPRQGVTHAGGYNNPYMAQVAENIGGLLLGRETPNQRVDREAKAALTAAQTRKTTLEGNDLEYGAKAREAAALRRGAIQRLGLNPDTPDEALTPEQQKSVNSTIGQILLSHGLTGKTNYDQLTQGEQRYSDRTLQEDVLAGRRTAGAVGESAAARQGKPLLNVNDGTRFNQFDSAAPMTTTEKGRSAIGLNAARVKTEGTKQERNRAAAAKSGRESLGETLLGVDENGNEQYKLVPKTPGAILTRTSKAKAAKDSRPKLPFNSGKILDEEIGAQLNGMDLTPEDKTAIRERASQLYPDVGNATESVRRARSELGYDVVEVPGRIFGTNKKFSKDDKRAPTDLSDDELLKKLGAK